MGSSSGGGRRYISFRSRQRANMSFFIVVMFFAVFGIIVFTEIFLIDERGRGAGVLVRHGSLSYHSKHQDKADYDDFQNDDYISIRLGAAMMNEDTFQSILLGGRPPAAIPVIDNSASVSSKVLMENQLPPYPDYLTPSDGKWQSVHGTRYKFFVFSAFYDKRKGQRSVRIIGATKTRGPDRVWCRMWYKYVENNTISFVSRTSPAKVKLLLDIIGVEYQVVSRTISLEKKYYSRSGCLVNQRAFLLQVIRENWNLLYSACFVMCPLSVNQTVPISVSIVYKVKDHPANLLTVGNNYNDTSLRSNMSFSVCVKPFHFDYNREMQLLEFIELNRIMGVEHFTFYNHTIGQQVNCILKDYIEKGIVTLLPWQLDMVTQKEIRTEGLFAALNDCLYRNMYRYSHVLLIDLDEYIIPNYNDTLPQLIDSLNKRLNTRSTGSYSFQNAFFYLQWSDDESVYDFNDPVAANLVTLRKTRRKTKLHPHKQRSKYICRPELIVEAGNHFIWEFIPGHGTLNVPSDAAFLHHYRICEFGGNDCIKTSSMVDKTSYRYKDQLISVVTGRYQDLKEKCALNELKDPPSKPMGIFLSILKGNS